MEKQGKSRKSLLLSVIAAVVVLAALLTMTFTGCFGGQDDPTTDSTSQSGDTGESGGNVEKGHELYWNVDREEAAGKRQPESDGFYHIVFAKDGKQVTLRVADKKLVETIDSQDMVGLVLDDKGDITEVVKMKDLPFEILAENYYVAAIKDGLVELKKNQDLTGEDAMFKLEDSTQILDMTGVSGEVGAKTTLNKEDGVTVILNEDGEAVYVYVVNRAAAAVTVKKTCEHCKQEVEWISWTKNASLPTAAGHYYLDCDVNLTAESVVAAGAQICLDLNGKTINGAANERVFVTNANSVLSIVDTTEAKAGKVVVSGKNMDTGNCLYAKGGTINIYAGTFDASKATSTANGTAVAVNANATVNMYGGKIIGGTSKKNAENAFGCAGSVQIEDKGTFNLYDGEVTGGKAYNLGGQFRVIGTFNMYGGKVTNGTAYESSGGNISVARAGKLNISGGYILNGTAVQNSSGGGGNGGNIFCEGAFTMNGGYVAGGRSLDKNNKAIDNANSRNVYHRNQAFTMYGGEILGYMFVTDTSATDAYNTSIFVSGLANISRAAEGHNNLSWSTRVSFSIGKLLKGAKVSVAVNMGDKLVDRGDIDEAKWNSYQAMIDNGCLVCDNTKYGLKVKEDGIYVVDPNAVYHCVCGDPTSTGNACADEGHKQVAWTAWEATDSLPTSGNYYLTQDVVLKAACSPKAGTADAVSVLAIDLNGKKISAGAAIRLFQVTQKYSKLIITDTVGTGKIDYTYSNEAANFGYGIQMNAANASVDMYGGEICGTRYASTGGAALIMGSGCNAKTSVFNMYGGTITGGEGAKGGNVFMHNGIFNLYGGVVSNGKARNADKSALTDGGNFYLNNLGGKNVSATLNVYGGKIVGGSAKNGSSIYANNAAVVNISGGEITGVEGAATGVIYMAKTSTLNITGGKITGNTAADNGSTVLLTENASMNMSGGEITGNTSTVNSGAVRVQGTATLTVSGAAKITGNTGNDVYLDEGRTITVGEAGLTTGENGALIGVAMKTPDVFTSNAVAEGAEKCFKSNTFGYKVYKNSMNMLALIPGQEDDGGEDGVRHCVCGDPTLKIGTCAEGSHIEYTWTEWTETTALPAENGFYYLSADVALTEASKPNNTNVTVDLNGFSITQSTADAAIVELDGNDIYTFTNTKNEGKVDGTVTTDGSSSLTVYRSQIKSIDNKAGTVKLYSGKIDAATVAGDFVVSGNIVITNATVADGAVITVDEKILTGNGGASIGVTLVNKDAFFAVGEFTNAVKGCFTSVDTAYSISSEFGGLRLRGAGEVWHCLCGDPTITDENNPCAKAGHESIQWTKWDKTDSLPTATGNYYLSENVVLGSVETTNACVLEQNADVKIDLNGKTVTTTGARIFQLTKACTLTITDSVGGATLDFSGATSKGQWHGFGILLDKAGVTVNMYGGTITGTKVAGVGGACVALGSSANATTTVFNMYGGTITGGKASSKSFGGGNVFIHAGTFNLYDGTVSGGYSGASDSPNGGNFYLNNLGSGTVATAILNIHGGKILGGEAVGGGSIYAKGVAQINLYGGEIANVDGTTSGTIALWNSATLNMSGGKITGNATRYKGAAVLLNNTSVMTMSGGEITGNTSPNTTTGAVQLQDTSKLVVSGTAKITGNTGPNVYLNAGTTITIGEGGLTVTDEINGIEGAIIGVTMATPGKFATGVAPDGVFTSDVDTYQVTVEAEGIFLRDANLIYGCICGAADGEEHVGECDGFDVLWTKLEATSDLANGGCFYLDADTTVADVTVAEGKTLAIDLKGKTLTGNVTATAANTKLYVLDSVGGGKLAGTVNANDAYAFGGTITKAAVNGSFVVAGDVKIEVAVVAADKFITVSKSGLTAGENGAKIVLSAEDASKAVVKGETKEDAACFVSAVETLKINREGDGIHLRPVDEMWHCICADVDSEVESSCAKAGHIAIKWTAWESDTTLPTTAGYYYLKGNVQLSAACVPAAGTEAARNVLAIDLNGQTISIKDDANIRLFELTNAYSTLIIADSVGTGKLDYTSTKTAASYGYGIQINAANTTVDLYGGTITGTRYASTGGAAIMIGSGANATTSIVNMYGGAITDGSGDKGGNVFMHKGIFNLYGGVVSGGQATKGTAQGGNFWLNGSNANYAPTLNVYGGTIENGSAGMGGNVFLNSGYAKLHVEGGKIQDGTAKTKGGNILLNGASTFEMEDGQILGGSSNSTTTAVGISVHAQGTSKVNISGGEISGCNASTSEYSAVYIAASGVTFTVSGDARIVGNSNQDGVRNVYLVDGAKITVGSTGLGENASIGVTMATPGNFTSNAVDAAQLGCFVSDKDAYEVAANDDGSLKLVAKAAE